jgi:hypothetical protein
MNWFSLPTTSRFHGRLPGDTREGEGRLMCMQRHCDQPAAEGVESQLCVEHEADRLDEEEAQRMERLDFERGSAAEEDRMEFERRAK